MSESENNQIAFYETEDGKVRIVGGHGDAHENMRFITC